MSLKKSTGNMYSWVTHMWNPVRGKCPYECSYCYVSRMAARFRKEQKPLYLDDVEATKDLGRFNTVFVCSGCDLFHPDIPDLWIKYIGQQAFDFGLNTYVLHTKNPERAARFFCDFPTGTVLCATIETDRDISAISKAPPPAQRFEGLKKWPGDKMITAEPILRFEIPEEFAKKIISCNPIQVNIGADSGRNNLPEPTREKVEELLELLAPHTRIYLKRNLRRILPESGYYG
jgi:DNA repair photolyase